MSRNLISGIWQHVNDESVRICHAPINMFVASIGRPTMLIYERISDATNDVESKFYYVIDKK